MITNSGITEETIIVKDFVSNKVLDKARGKNTIFFMHDELDEYQINPEMLKKFTEYISVCEETMFKEILKS